MQRLRIADVPTAVVLDVVKKGPLNASSSCIPLKVVSGSSSLLFRVNSTPLLGAEVITMTSIEAVEGPTALDAVKVYLLLFLMLSMSSCLLFVDDADEVALEALLCADDTPLVDDDVLGAFENDALLSLVVEEPLLVLDDVLGVAREGVPDEALVPLVGVRPLDVGLFPFLCFLSLPLLPLDVFEVCEVLEDLEFFEVERCRFWLPLRPLEVVDL